MSGLIVMACGETARFSEPYDSLMNLQRPGGWEYRSARSTSIAENWNDLGRYVLASSHEWLFLVNDDNVYPAGTLPQLLSHQRDVVSGIYLSRQAPFAPILYDQVFDDGTVRPRYLSDGEHGLVQAEACGDGCLLLHRKVLEAIPQPWWELAVRRADACDHDTAFSAKIRQAGFSIWCDLAVTVGHLAVMPIFPAIINGRWTTIIIAGPQQTIALPAAQSPLAVPRGRIHAA